MVCKLEHRTNAPILHIGVSTSQHYASRIVRYVTDNSIQPYGIFEAPDGKTSTAGHERSEFYLRLT
jgi:hypothetical protein